MNNWFGINSLLIILHRVEEKYGSFYPWGYSINWLLEFGLAGRSYSKQVCSCRWCVHCHIRPHDHVITGCIPHVLTDVTQVSANSNSAVCEYKRKNELINWIFNSARKCFIPLLSSNWHKRYLWRPKILC